MMSLCLDIAPVWAGLVSRLAVHEWQAGLWALHIHFGQQSWFSPTGWKILLSWLCFWKHLYSLLSVALGLPHVFPFQVRFSGLPWWLSGWESAFWCRGYGFNPWSGKILHAAKQLTPCGPQLLTPTLEPESHNHQGLEPVLHNKRNHCSEKAVRTAMKSSIKYLPQLEKACTQQWKPNVAKINK